MKYCILTLFFLFLYSCKTKQEASVYSRSFQLLVVYPLQNSDTVLVMNYASRQPTSYSFHVLDSTENGYLLKNKFNEIPSVEFVSAQKDSILSIFLVDENNNDVIYRINPFIHLNDSVKSWYTDHGINFNIFERDKFDSVQSLRFVFLEGFGFEIKNLPIGKLTFKIKNYKGETGNQSTYPYYKNYYLSSPTINEGFLKFEEDSIELYHWRNDTTKFVFKQNFEIKQKDIKDLKKEIGKHNFPKSDKKHTK